MKRICWLLLLATANSPISWAQTTLYACPVGKDEAVYASEPLSVDCQPAKRQQGDALEASTTTVAKRLWYQHEFGSENDITVLPRQSAPKMAIRLRRPQPAKVAPAAVRIPPPAKPLSPRQLIQRDIANEQRALNRERQQWQQARQQGNSSRASSLQQAIADREANIRALQQELGRQ